MKRRVLLAVLAVTLLASCQAETATTLKVHRDGTIEPSIALTITGTAADTILADPDLGDQLDAAIGVHLTKFNRKDAKHSITYQARPGAETLLGLKTLTGVGAVGLDLFTDPSTGLKAETVQVVIIDPVDLHDVYRQAVAGRDDASTLLATMEANTQITVVVTFPGDVTGADDIWQISGKTATISMSLTDLQPGAYNVWGLLRDPLPTRTKILLAAGLILVLILGYAVTRP